LGPAWIICAARAQHPRVVRERTEDKERYSYRNGEVRNE